MTAATAIKEFTTLRPAIKAEWNRRLRAEEPPSVLGHPDLLVFLMDETLERVTKGLRQSDENWLRQAAPVVAPLQPHCACSLNPLLAYYATGDQALRAVVESALPRVLSRILVLFHALAQQEIENLCGTCQHRQGPLCAHGAANPRPQ